MTDAHTPPKPILTLRVGVTGHRLNKLAPDVAERLRPLVGAALDGLRRVLADVHARHPDAYDPAPPVLRIVSPLAEGADRLVANEGLARGAELMAPLPFARDVYARDFADDRSRADYLDLLGRAATVIELDGRYDSENERNTAYSQVGALVVQQSDVVIALWDGASARDRGGTAEIVEIARRGLRPVLWLPTTGSEAPRLLTAGPAPAGDALAALLEIIRNMLTPPDDPPRLRPWALRWLGGPGSGPRAAYFAEVNPRSDWGDLFNWLTDRLTGGKRPFDTKIGNFVDNTRRAWNAALKPLAETPGFKDPRVDRMAQHFAWIDGLASFYSGRFRSAYVAIYLLGAICLVLIGVELKISSVSGIASIIAGIDLVVALAIGVLISWGVSQHWHRRWIEYREVAERLRTLHFLRCVASPPASPRLPKHLHRRESTTCWSDWLYNAIIREVGLPSTTMRKDYIEALRRFLTEVEIEGQIQYHVGNARRLHAFDRLLHEAGILAFLLSAGVAALLALAFLWSEGSPGSELIRSVIGLATIVAIGFAMAFYSIRNQGELARIAERSERMEQVLAEIRAELEKVDGELNQATLARLAQDVAETMLIETSDWRVVFLGRPLGVPA